MNTASKPENSDQDPEQDLDKIFHALADPTRRALIQRLSKAPHSVGELAMPFDMSLNAVSKHLKTLEKANLIERDTTGRTSICSLKTAPLHDIQTWLDTYTRFWNDILDNFEQHMDQQEVENLDAQPKKAKSS
ncbi:MAG: transcriptional regulator [Hyphomicrobiales bacterium]|nr:helix-turn-helix transcriptional regulator [Hyphomicrobiales bacterium]PCJ82834.1 MAG: transcriptional regulator [Hyphomicrobiales bacterium]